MVGAQFRPHSELAVEGLEAHQAFMESDLGAKQGLMVGLMVGQKVRPPWKGRTAAAQQRESSINVC